MSGKWKGLGSTPRHLHSVEVIEAGGVALEEVVRQVEMVQLVAKEVTETEWNRA
jgi:hypothetical protein